jgi:hypothetical protein
MSPRNGKSAKRLSSSIGLAQVLPKTEFRVSTFLTSMSCRTRMYSGEGLAACRSADVPDRLFRAVGYALARFSHHGSSSGQRWARSPLLHNQTILSDRWGAATTASVKAGMATVARGTRMMSVSIVLFRVTGQLPRILPEGRIDPFCDALIAPYVT